VSPCTVDVGAANGQCVVDAPACDFTVADTTDPVTAFSDGAMAEVTVHCSAETTSGQLCLINTAASNGSGAVPVCTGDVCTGYQCATCIPGDCNQSLALDAGDPICTVLCVAGQPGDGADCSCGADCNCQNGTEAGDPICSVLRVSGAFSPDTCLPGNQSSIAVVATQTVVAKPATDSEDSDRAVVRLKGDDASRVGGMRVMLESGAGAGDVRLSRRLARRGFSIQYTTKDGKVGVLVVPPPRLPIESIGRGAVLRVRHGGAGARLGAVEYGSTEGQPLQSAGDAAAAAAAAAAAEQESGK
jgi:hypothetical protein